MRRIAIAVLCYFTALFLFLIAMSSCHAQTKISNLPAASALTGVEAFPCVQSATTDKCTVTQAATFLFSLVSGDCTATAGGAHTCTKTNGVSFGSLATLSTVNNSNWSGAALAIANGGTGQTSANAAFNALSPMTTIGDTIFGAASGVATRLANGTTGQFLGANTGAAPSWQTPAGGGTVTSVSWTGGLVSIATATTTPAFTVAGTSGGIPYFSNASTLASSAALTANMPVIGGGAGVSPAVGTVTGNQTQFVTSTGSHPSGNCGKWDASGNLIDSGAACGGGGGVATAWSDFSTSFFYPFMPQQLAAAVGAVGSASVIQCTPVVVTEKMTLAALSANITTLSAAGNFQLALYTSVSGRPGVLIANTGSGSTGATGFISPTFASGSGSSVQVGPGGAQGGVSLWACANRDNAVVVFTPNGTQSPGPYATTALIGSATTANLIAVATAVVGISCSGANCNGGSSTFGTWPTLTGSTWTDITTRQMPIVFYQPSSIP